MYTDLLLWDNAMHIRHLLPSSPIAAALSRLLLTTFVAATSTSIACADSAAVTQSVENGAEKTKDAIVYGAEKAKSGVVYGAEKTRDALDSAAAHTGHALHTAADKTADALKTAGDKVNEKLGGKSE